MKSASCTLWHERCFYQFHNDPCVAPSNTNHMKNFRQALTQLALGAAIAIPMSSANAGLLVNFYNGADLYAKLSTSGSTSFSLEFVGTGVAAGGFVNELFLDGPNGSFSNTTAPGVTSVSGSYNLNGYNGGGGQKIYDWQIQFPNANNSSRLTVGETATWSIVTTDASAWLLDKIHINAFDGVNSIKLDGCIDGTAGCGGNTPAPVPSVPEPGALALVSLALLGAGLAGRRKA